MERYALFFSDLRSGGAERVMAGLAARLAGQVEVHVLVLRRAQNEVALPPALPLHVLGARNHRRALPALVSALRRLRPQALLTSLLRADCLGIVAGAWTGVPVVVRPDSPPSQAREWWLRRIVRACYPRAAGVVALTGRIEAEARAMGVAAARIAVVPNPVELERIEALAAQGRPLEGPYLVSVGRQSVEKDLPTLLRAFRLLVDRGYPGRLVHVGDGPLAGQHAALAERLGIAERVVFAGHQPNPFPWVRPAQLLVSTSVQEGMPNGVLEAMALGKTVVACDCPSGPADVTDGGRLGFLSPVRNADAFCAAVQRALQAPIQPELLRERIRVHHDPARVARSYLTALRAVRRAG